MTNKHLHQWIGDELNKLYFQELMKKVHEEDQQHLIFPPPAERFQAFELTAYENVKVVILGQDPYHGRGQAHGLAFSVQEGVKLPPSLKNIYTELEHDLAIPPAPHGCLKKWAAEGVLLLNTVLTVRAGEAHSHKHLGWETFTDAVIKKLSERRDPIAFILWGKPAQTKRKWIAKHHLIIESAHPSPLSAYRGFFGSKPFSQVNEWLREQGKSEIDWKLD